MNPAIFRKGDAPSVLVVDKSWDDIIDKPDFFDELAERIVKMADAAGSIGLMKKATTFSKFKEAINTVLMDSLLATVEQEGTNPVRKDGSVLVDAFWDEIIKPNDVLDKLQVAITRAYEMKLRIEESSPLKSSDTLMKSKDTFNETVLKPLLGYKED